MGGGAGALRAPERGARQPGDDGVRDAHREREIRVAPGSAGGACRVTADHPQRSPGGGADVGDPPGRDGGLEVSALGAPRPGFNVLESCERVCDRRQFPGAADSPAGLATRFGEDLLASVAVRGEVTVAL